jgi:hypothetical protein
LASLDHHLGALAIVPPLGLGPSFIAPALAVSLACLFGVLMLGAISRGNVRRMAPAGLCLLSLTLILWTLAIWNVLS